MNIEAFVIHLARATQRRPQVDALVSQLPMQTHVLDAVDGSALPSAAIAAVYRNSLHRPRYPFALREAEVGCFLSHRKAWQSIVDGGLDAGLIVEDDVQPQGALFEKVLTLALNAGRPDDFIRFPYRAYTDKGTRLVGDDNAMIVEPKLPGLGMQMQLVGRQAAAELLRTTEVFDRPVDTTIQMRWLTNARILAARPVCIRQIDYLLGGTVVQKKAKPVNEVLAREVKRAMYRVTLHAVAASKRMRP